MKKKTSGKLTNIVLVLIFLAGLSLLLYPTVSDYWNSLHASRAVSEYAEQVNALAQDRYKDLWKQAVDYNRTPFRPGEQLHPDGGAAGAI